MAAEKEYEEEPLTDEDIKEALFFTYARNRHIKKIIADPSKMKEILAKIRQDSKKYHIRIPIIVQSASMDPFKEDIERQILSNRWLKVANEDICVILDEKVDVSFRCAGLFLTALAPHEVELEILIGRKTGLLQALKPDIPFTFNFNEFHKSQKYIIQFVGNGTITVGSVRFTGTLTIGTKFTFHLLVYNTTKIHKMMMRQILGSRLTRKGRLEIEKQLSESDDSRIYRSSFMSNSSNGLPEKTRKSSLSGSIDLALLNLT